MDDIVCCVTSNIWAVCLIEGRWNKLRVCHELSVLPSLIHDLRPLSSLTRFMTSDSRESVLRVLTKTLSIFSDLVDLTDKDNLTWMSPVRSMVKDNSQAFLAGLRMLEQNYDYDVSVKIQVKQLEQKWSSICVKFEGGE